MAWRIDPRRGPNGEHYVVDGLPPRLVAMVPAQRADVAALLVEAEAAAAVLRELLAVKALAEKTWAGSRHDDTAEQRAERDDAEKQYKGRRVPAWAHAQAVIDQIGEKL